MDDSQVIMDDTYYMKLALREAQMAYHAGEIPIGCVMVCRDTVVARCHNMTQRLTDVTAHAEMQAITAASEQLGGKYLNDCTLYVTVEPCIMCAGALGWAQLGRLVFGCPDEKRGYQRFAPQALHPRTTVQTGVMEQECAELMTSFFRSRR